MRTGTNPQTGTDWEFRDYFGSAPWTHEDIRRVVPVAGQKLYLKYHLASTDDRADGEGGSSINRLHIAALDARELEQHRLYEGKLWTETEFGGLTHKDDDLYPLLQQKTSWRDQVAGFFGRREIYNGKGILRTSADEILPLYYVQTLGEGAWVAVNHPGLFTFHQSGRGASQIDWSSWETRLGLLNAILREEAGTELANYLEVNVTQAEGMVLASRPRESRSDFSRTEIPFVHSGKGDPVLFDTYAHDRVMPQHYDAATGQGVLLGDLSDPFAVGLWLVKDSDRPRMLYADGSFKQVARIDDGIYEEDQRVLRVTFAERAWIYSPEPPVRVTGEEGEISWDHDAARQLLHLSGPGYPAEIQIIY